MGFIGGEEEWYSVNRFYRVLCISINLTPPWPGAPTPPLKKGREQDSLSVREKVALGLFAFSR